MTNSVLISGAGLAGPALAYWLRRYGFEPTVVERAPALRAGGYKVDVRGAATEVLKRMGAYPRSRALDTGMRHITYVRRDGRPIAVLDANLLMGRRGDDIEIMRTDLTRVLHHATAGEVEYVFGDSIAAMHDGPDGVDVTFASGASRRFSLVVGADGLHSTTRRLAFGEVPLTHLGAYISIFTVPNHLRLDREEIFHVAPGRLVFTYANGPDDDARVGLTFASPELPRLSQSEQKDLLRSKFGNLGWAVPRFLDALCQLPTPGPPDGVENRGNPIGEDVDDLYFDALSQVEMPRWSAGRVALAGDAAHCPAPASGQGTSLALVGAYVLAGELAAAHGDHTRAFPAYERAMRPYVEQNLAFGRKMADDMVPGSRFMIALRHYGMRTLKSRPTTLPPPLIGLKHFHRLKEQVIERVLRPLHEAANAIELRDYDRVRVG